jgi:hypothetical protein
MSKHIAAIALLMATMVPLAVFAACACPRPELSYLYKTSVRAFFGEVVKVEILTKDPVDGKEATYVATVRPVEVFKGASNADVRVTFTKIYTVPKPPIPARDPPMLDPAFGERSVTYIDSDRCGSSHEMAGGKYYIFEKQGEPLTYSGWCTERVVEETAATIDVMRGLQQRRER